MGEAKRKKELLARCTEELKAWGTRSIAFEIDIGTTLALCGALQLSLRHPEASKQSTAQVVRSLVFDIKSQIPAEFPAIRELIELGFHPRFDSPFEAK